MRSFLFIFCLLFVGICNSQTGIITDSRDGKVYKTVVIGNQTWMAENLNVSTFRNGDTILEATTKEEWVIAGQEGKPAWCYYKNEQKNETIIGKIYNWYAVNDSRGLAPEGWHIPKDNEWSILINFLGSEEYAGTKMKSTKGWECDYDLSCNGSNASGFKGLPGGMRFANSAFTGIGTIGGWWSATESGVKLALKLKLNNYDGFANRGTAHQSVGLSVRCIKD